MKKNTIIKAAVAASGIFASQASLAVLDQWGTYTSAGSLSCASFSPTCSVGTSPSGVSSTNDNFQGSSASSTLSDVRGSAQASASLVGNGGLNTAILRAQASGNLGGIASASAYALEGYTYSGASTSITVDLSLTGTVSDPSDSAFNDINGRLYIVDEESLDGFGSINLNGYFGEVILPIATGFLVLEATGVTSGSLNLSLEDGDTFYLYSQLFLSGANGGFSESMNSLTFSFSDTTGLSSIGTPAVPVPAAAWLFGSALLGLGGVKRRRS